MEPSRIHEAAFKALDQAIIVTEPDGAVLRVNPSAAALTGVAAHEAVGRPFDDLLVGLRLVGHESPSALLMCEGETPACAHGRYLSDGGAERPVAVLAHPWREDNVSVGFIVVIEDVPEEHRDAQASAARNETLVETAQEMIYAIDRADRVEYVNSFAARQLGARPEDIVGMARSELFPPQTIQAQTRSLRKVFQTGRPVRVEDPAQLGGRRVWLDTQLVPLKDETGHVTAVLGVSRDISDRKRIEDSLRESEQTAWAMLNATSEIAVLVDTDWKILAINEPCAKAFGRPVPDLLGESLFCSMAPDVAVRRRAVTERVLRTGEPVRFMEGRLGREFTTAIYPIRDGEGKISRAAIFVQDMTELRRAEDDRQAARDELERFVSIINRSPIIVLIWEVAEGWPVVFASEGIKQFGYTPEELTSGQVSWVGMTHPEDVPRLEAEVAQYKADGVEEFAQSYRLLTKDGEVRWVEDRTAALRDADGNAAYYAGTIVDVSEHERARDSQRLAAVGQLAAGVAHEFNNLLAALMLRAELALDGIVQDDMQLAEFVVRSATYGANICSNLTTFASPGDPRRHPIAIEAPLEAAVGMAAPHLHNSSIVIKRDYDTRGKCVDADMGQLEQVFVNIILNARQAMPEGGTLTLQTRCEPSDGEPQTVVACIGDTGVGISAEHRSRIFEPFFTTKGRFGESESPGTGLGLSVSYGIVAAHGGTISALGEPGRGTVFEVRLPTPLSVDAAADSEATSAEQALTTAQNSRVLVAEDCADLRGLISTALTHAGLLTIAVTTVAEALATLRSTEIALVVTDLLMPDGGGQAIVQAVREMLSPPPVLVITGKTGPEATAQVEAMGAEACLVKPFSRQDLLRTVQALLNGD